MIGALKDILLARELQTIPGWFEAVQTCLLETVGLLLGPDYQAQEIEIDRRIQSWLHQADLAVTTSRGTTLTSKNSTLLPHLHQILPLITELFLVLKVAMRQDHTLHSGFNRKIQN